jgi:Flp pilus assembly protein TadG
MRRRNGLLKQFGSTLVRFGRDERAVTLIEFGLLAVPFFTIIGAILETAMVFLAGQILDSAVQDSARLVRTGRAQTAGYVEADFREAICSGLYNLFDCTAGDNDKLRINVAVVDNFEDISIGYPLKTGSACTSAKCDWTLPDAYDGGVGGDVMLVQAFYKWPTFVNLPGLSFANLPDGTRLLGASRVFRNEPFGCSDCT